MQPAISSNKEVSGNGSLLEIQNLKVWFPIRSGFVSSMLGGEDSFVRAVDGVSFNVEKGEIFSLAGESGSGKTTLGKAVLGLVNVTSGDIFFNGANINQLKSRPNYMQMIYQDPYEALPPHLTVFDIIAEPLDVNNLVSNYEEKTEKVKEAMDIVEVSPFADFRDKYPHQLSGGQRQRVAVAAALVVRPQLIIADEPVSMLDASIRARIIELMLDLRKDFGLTYIFISHDLALASYIAEKIAIMYLGQVVELGDIREIVTNPLHPYTKALLSVVPIPDPTAKRDKIILQGEIPSPIDIAPGCRFYSRCPVAKESCKANIDPEMIEIQKDHYVACYQVN
jgi:oligopeptide/dipeptide ABC transporter ATP-binding protein